MPTETQSTAPAPTPETLDALREERDRLRAELDEALTRERAQLVTHNRMAGNLREHDAKREQLGEVNERLLAFAEKIATLPAVLGGGGFRTINLGKLAEDARAAIAKAGA